MLLFWLELQVLLFTKMNYKETLDYLYSQLPMFQRVGATAYKEGLDNSLALDELYEHPHRYYKTIHVGGTNGKGSVSHLLSAILQKNGYRVGLYTSPHLIDFRERIRVNGEMISEEDVISFVEDYKSKETNLKPSFFELTMMMAFDYFKKSNVDIAVIEVGLGGRLDSTNIITPILSVTTNISYDHTQFLGDTLEKIATEKAGIIKEGIPIVVGEANGSVKLVFEEKAKSVNSPITFAGDEGLILGNNDSEALVMETAKFGMIKGQLSGKCQILNANTVLASINQLSIQNILISKDSVIEGFGNVMGLTGLKGRWMKISDSPLTICDTGHNVAGVKQIVEQLREIKKNKLRIVLGFVNDKQIDKILDLLPKDAIYYFTKASDRKSVV